MKKLTFTLPQSLILLTAASLAVAAAMFFIQPRTGIAIFTLIRESHGLIFLLNWLPVLCLMLILFFAFGHLVSACALPAFMFMLLSVANRYMIAMRWSPLKPLDLLLGAEFAGIAKSIRPAIFIAVGVGVLLFTAFYALCIYFIKNKKMLIPIRIAGVLLGTAVLLTLNFTVYGSHKINEGLPYQGSPYNETQQFQSKGFVYMFLYTLNNSRITKPTYYDDYRKTIEAAEQEALNTPPPATQGTLPNVIMILGEAFSEIPLSPLINYDGYAHPMSDYLTVKEEALWGYHVAPHIGGGTADTEFDILTGINTRDFSGVPYAFSMITRPFPGVTRVFKQVGYDAIGQHPGAGWFYNRQNVYPLLGFDAFNDDQIYDTHDTKGMYITERQTYDKMIDEVQRHLSQSETPLFLDCITIQNHGPYIGKYKSTVNFNTSLSLTADETEILSNYFEGIADGARELLRLVNYLKTVEEPMVLLYYGDHLPSLPPALYEMLIPESADERPGDDLIRYYRLPFLIWANEAGQAILDTAAFEQSLPADRTISPQYLGAALLEMIGLSAHDPLLAHVNAMRAQYPVILSQTYRDAKGITHPFNPEETPALALYRSWAYYRIVS